MRCGEGIEVDWDNLLEELALMQDADSVSTYETTKAVSGNGKLGYHPPGFLDVFHFLNDLVTMT